ncbi:hypothetical protein AB0N05_22055 [Nocardia sp. NPDC051030]|uniref:DUF7373 family lipoprotein n=1 Tax=Nocardia sp. NPDC051030 TaxID=3155162 RepID=UPI00343C3CD4
MRNSRLGRRTGRAVFAALSIALASSALAGCGTVAGSPAAGEIDVRTLAVGNYPTNPIDVRGAYRHSVSYGRALAVARLSDAVVIGADVGPGFVYTALSQPSTDYAIATAAKPALDRNNMVLAYSASVSDRPRLDTLYFDNSGNASPLGGWERDPEATTFNATVMQFPDEQRARAAAEEIESADFDVAPDLNARVTLDKHPSARAHWRPGVPTLAAIQSRGAYVVSVYVKLPKPELDGLKDLAGKVLDAQFPLLDQIPPLTQRDILRLDYDPQNMLRRTLHPGDYPYPSKDEVTRTPRGYLKNVADQGVWKQLLDTNGVDQTSTTQKGALLFRARDAEAATTLWSGINALIPTSTDAPPGVPGVTCAQNPKSSNSSNILAWDYSDRYLCTLHYDRYVARVASSQLADAQQRATAQYALLAKAQYL